MAEMRAIIDSDYQDIRLRFNEAKIEPIGGWLWLEEHILKTYPEQKMTIFYDGKPLRTLTNDDKPTKKAVKTIMDNCSKVAY